MAIEPIEVNGWTIKPCSTCTGGYEVSRTESYPEPTLEAAVRAAQRFTPESLLMGDPEAIDTRLRKMMTDDQRLAFYQWIGAHAVREALAAITYDVGQDPAPPEHRSYSQDTVYEFINAVHPDNDGGLFPSKLPE